MATSASGNRFCPLCEVSMAAEICPTDGVHTVALSAVVGSKGGLQPGSTVGGRYEVKRSIGKGAMGVVYEAVQLSMHRTVALKILNANVMDDGRELKRFYQEARSASLLKHPNVVAIYDFGVDDGIETPFIAMELIEGRSLRDIIEMDSPIPIARACTLLGQVSKALAAAHAGDIVHRDLKPDNIMVALLAGGEEHVKVLDFGIAKVLGKEAGLQGSLTASGALIGTPRYMSPEQIQPDQAVGPRADLYALGCILHELVLGEPPFSATDALELMLRHANAIAPPLPERTRDGRVVPAPLIQLHASLLAKRPEKRPEHASEVSQRLLAVARAEPPSPTPKRARSFSRPAAFEALELSSLADTNPAQARLLDASSPSLDLDAPPRSRASRTWVWALGLALLGSVVAAGGYLAMPSARPLGLEPNGTGASVGKAEAGGPSGVESDVAGPRRSEDPGSEPTSDPSVDRVVSSSQEQARIEKTISARPEADIYVDGEKVGVTPVNLEIPREGLDVVARRPGYYDARVRLHPSDPRVRTVRLRRRPDRKPPPLAPR